MWTAIYEREWVSHFFRDLALRPGVGAGNPLPVKVALGYFNPNTTIRTTITVIQYSSALTAWNLSVLVLV